jgi:anti-sigma-K factor RskA
MNELAVLAPQSMRGTKPEKEWLSRKEAAVIAVLFALLAVPAYAQQPQQPSMVQQLMANDANIKAALAEQLDKANAQIAALKAENEALKKAQEKPKDVKP